MHTLADFTGAGSTVQVSATNKYGSWVQFIVTGAGTVRIGDSSTTISQGLPFPSGGAMFLPVRPKGGNYNLSFLYMYIPTGATVSVAYGG